MYRTELVEGITVENVTEKINAKIEEILQENLKEGGKYIVFIPVGGNEEGKDSIDKVKEWKKKIQYIQIQEHYIDV